MTLLECLIGLFQSKDLAVHATIDPHLLNCWFYYRFTKQYAKLGQMMVEGMREYHEEVKAGLFPTPQNTYPINEAELSRFFEGEEQRKAQNQSNHSSDNHTEKIKAVVNA
jgi:RNA binding exosome subunit